MPDYTFEVTLTDDDIFDAVSIRDIVEYFGRDLLSALPLQDVIDCVGNDHLFRAIGKQDMLDWLGAEAMVDWLEKNAPSVLRDDKQEELPVLTPEE